MESYEYFDRDAMLTVSAETFIKFEKTPSKKIKRYEKNLSL